MGGGEGLVACHVDGVRVPAGAGSVGRVVEVLSLLGRGDGRSVGVVGGRGGGVLWREWGGVERGRGVVVRGWRGVGG